jgi:hypothetical protein
MVCFVSLARSWSLATWTCLPNFFRSLCFLASALAFLLAASSISFALIFAMCSSAFTISAK